jgi:hypothetical protein
MSFGQDRYLKPSDLDKNGVLGNYYDGLFPLLHKGFANKPVARYTLIPSFSSEFAFSAEVKDGRFFINSNYLSTSYWYAKNKQNVKVKHAFMEIDNELYVKITTLFDLVIKQARMPENNTLGLDGETSYLSTTENGTVRTGEIWSPNKASLMGRLVEICKQLYLIGLGKNVSQDEVVTQINHLMFDLQ